MNHYDVGIVGGGIIGQSIAYQLAKEGLAVVVFESNRIGKGATSAAAGMLGANSELENNDAFFSFAKESQRQYHKLCEELLQYSQINIQLVDNGMYKLALTDSEAESLQHTTKHHQAIEWHPKDIVLNNEPNVTNEIKGALYIPEDGHVSPIHVCAAFAKSASHFGATILENTPVQRIQKVANDEYRLSTPHANFTCEHVVVANGVWSNYFFNELGVQSGLKPVKGECFSFQSSEIHLERTLFFDHCYIVPKGDGRFVVGASMVENDWSTEPTLGGIQSLFEKVIPILPNIKSAKLLETWAGLRPQTDDGKPYIGKHPTEENLYFATGHYRNGILLAPKTGTMIRDFILKRTQQEEYVNAFSLDRKLVKMMR
ncbi:glycine oxidase [Metabacillus malikii]|uniref:glycine oxidase n=1 Tax=Metabacillus malikii TaxID=1504265 RepID=A0ABT9ZFR1_9BACI|nr:glycine oxidase [Metabacillus malikii]